MPTIDQLLSRAQICTDLSVPADTVPYEDCAYPAFTPDGAALVDDEPADDMAAKDLQTLCEVVVTYSTSNALEFLTDQVPQPHGAWVLGCALKLADVEEGARFWWQYAAGAADEASSSASYCLYLHHLSHGEWHAASFWLDQADLDTSADASADTSADTAVDTSGDAPGSDVPRPRGHVHPAALQDSYDASLATVLRILGSLLSPGGRTRTQRADALTTYVANAVTDGYASNPDVEIPLPGPRFADRVAFILANALPLNIRRPSRPLALPARFQHGRAPRPYRALETARGSHT